MTKYARTVLKISVMRSYRVINPNLKFLVQNITSLRSGERYNSETWWRLCQQNFILIENDKVRVWTPRSQHY